MPRTPLRRALALTLLAGLLTALPPAGPPAHADSHTVGRDTLRTSWDRAEPDLAPGTITSGTFGELFSTQLVGQVYAQPLVIGRTVVAATEENWVYGLDAVTGAVRWSRQLGPAWPAATTGCGDLTPSIGSTSTGVYDPASGVVYLTTKVDDGPDPAHPSWYLHAIDAEYGSERSGWPVRIVGTPANDPSHPFQAKDVNQRPGLLLMGGAVYLAFGGLCDYGSYVGWVAGVDVTTKAINLWSDEVGASSEQAGIWQSGGGIVSDGPGRMFLTTGNGVTPPNAPGSPAPQQLSQSLVRLAVGAGGVISAQDFFSPWNAATLDKNDQDLGSGGPVALPDEHFGTAATPHLMAQIGKEGMLYLLDRDHLGGKGQGPGGGDAVLQKLGPYRGVWGTPAVYGGEGGYLYVVQSYSSMLAFRYGTDGQGRPALTEAGNTAETFGYTAGSPIVTSDGTTPGSAVVWVVNVDGPTGAGGRLCAYRGVPQDSRLGLLRCFPIGTAAKFASPASSAGRIYVGTRDGRLFGFGQPTTAALEAPQSDLGDVPVGATATATVTATATRAVTVTAVGTTAPFTATAPPLPVTLAAGERLSVPVSFTPAAPGTATGTLTFTVTDGDRTATVGATLHGNGVRPGLTASPAGLDFGEVPVGGTRSLTTGFTNTGTQPETITAVTAPGAPFTTTGLPAAGLTVAPGQTVAVGVAYTPAAAGTHTATLAVTGPNGSATVALTGTGVTGTARLSVSPGTLAFGAVPVGQSATRTLTVANTGNLNVTVTKAAPPTLPFIVNTPLPEGLVLGPGDTVQIQVTFAPNAAGTFDNAYVISSDDGAGAHRIPVTGSATGGGGNPIPSVVGGGWVFNGSAQMTGADLRLTEAAPQQTGSAVYSTPVPGDDLDVAFTARLDGGTGADGMTFAMLAASSNTTASLGGGGGGLGVVNLPGVAVTLDTFRGDNDPSANFVGVTAGGSGGALTYAATATDVPDLRDGTHVVRVRTGAGRVRVAVDGADVIDVAVALPPSVLLAFTGSTGGAHDEHAVSGVTLSSGGTRLPAPGTGWRFNGSADANGADVVLTPARTQQAGTVLYSEPVATDGLSATFELSIGGGTGADGASFVMLAPQTPATSVGPPGDGLGYGGLPAVAVSFVTFPQGGVASANWVGIATSAPGGPPAFVAHTTAVPDLRAAARHCVVRVSGTTVSVSVDGTQVLAAEVPALGPAAVVGFAGSTGGMTDVHTVRLAQVVAA